MKGQKNDRNPSTYYVSILIFFHNRTPTCNIITKFKLYVMLNNITSVLSEHKYAKELLLLTSWHKQLTFWRLTVAYLQTLHFKYLLNKYTY